MAVAEYQAMFWRREEHTFDREEANVVIRYPMAMDAKLDEILALLREEDGGTELDA